MNNSKTDYPVQLGDKQYLFRFNYKAITFIEDVTDQPVRKCFMEMLQGRMKPVSTILLAALKHNHPKTTFEDVFDLIDEHGMEKILAELKTVMDSLFPDQKKTQPEVKAESNETIPSDTLTAESTTQD